MALGDEPIHSCSFLPSKQNKPNLTCWSDHQPLKTQLSTERKFLFCQGAATGRQAGVSGGLVSFNVTRVSVLPAPVLPSRPSLTLGYSASDLAWKLNWPADSVLYHLENAPSVTGPWTSPSQAFSSADGTNTVLVPLHDPPTSAGFFRLFKY